MTSISENPLTQPLGKGDPVVLRIEHTLIGALGAVAFLGLLALVNGPYAIVLGKAFILSVSLSAAAAIALIARHMGVLTPDEGEHESIAR